MTSREGRTALEDLRKLLASDLSTADPERLAAGVRAAELLFDEAQHWSGRLIAEMRRREDPPSSWAKLSQLTGVPPTTLRNRVAKHENGPPESATGAGSSPCSSPEP
ncbi:MAG: hypothetical protein ACRCZP_13095 [Phycicoccus sp.]